MLNHSFLFTIFVLRYKRGMRHILILLAFLVAFPVFGNAARKRAFMVGISSYTKHYYKVWHNIHGMQDVNLLTPELQKHGYRITSVLDNEATYQGITSALDQFIKSSKKGDVVYLHFSCHGQPVEDGIKGDTLDEKDGWDESLVPIDAGKEYCVNGYKGENHFTDDELNIYVERLRKQVGSTGIIYVVMDACHAGESSRGGMETIRGTNEGLTKSGRNYNPPQSDVRHFKIENGRGLAPIIFLEACKSRERNTEVRTREGKEYGALSYNVYHAIRQMKSFGNKDSQEFIRQVYKSIEQPGRWPKKPKQTLVKETSEM